MFGQKKKPPQCSDQELMRLLQSEASHGALEEIYRRYSGALLRYFYRMMWKDNERAQDMLHDVFVKVIENKNSFDVNRTFKTWIYSIAHNMCKNEYRKFELRKSVDHLVVQADEVDAGIDLQLDNDAFRERLSILLETLADEDRSLFTLRYENELQFNEIASILGMPEGTAKSRLFYLKKKLAEKLAGYKVINR